MARFIGAVLVAALVFGLSGPGRTADPKNANAILDKAIKALGGEAKLSKIKAASWKAKGTVAIMGNDNEYTAQATMQGLDHFRRFRRGQAGRS